MILKFPIFLFAMASTFLITVVAERRLIPYLRARAAQPIYEGGPSWHLSKSGTPTMGGLAFVTASVITVAVCSLYFSLDGNGYDSVSAILSVAYALLNAGIGFLDDLTKLKHKKNAGLSPLQKLGLQLLCSVAFLAARAYLLADDTAVAFSFGEVELGLIYYPFALIILLGITNCANLTDGVDGLSASVAFAIGAAMLFVSYGASDSAALISVTLIGATLGFLCFNLHPAKIFMGDTGSLFLGALAASGAFCMRNPAAMLPLGIVYEIEGVSVILQVAVYKIFKRRIFKMAPLHHHLEKSGVDENGICVMAIITTLIVSVIFSPLF